MIPTAGKDCILESRLPTLMMIKNRFIRDWLNGYTRSSWNNYSEGELKFLAFSLLKEFRASIAKINHQTTFLMLKRQILYKTTRRNLSRKMIIKKNLKFKSQSKNLWFLTIGLIQYLFNIEFKCLRNRILLKVKTLL